MSFAMLLLIDLTLFTVRLILFSISLLLSVNKQMFIMQDLDARVTL